MTHQMRNLCNFSVFHCVEGAFDATSRGTRKLQNRERQGELRNGRGRGWAVPCTWVSDSHPLCSRDHIPHVFPRTGNFRFHPTAAIERPVHVAVTAMRFGIPWPCYRGHLGPPGPKFEKEFGK